MTGAWLGTVAIPALPWAVGAVLALAATAALVLGLHAGGHGLLVPVPVVVLAVAWGFAGAGAGWTSPVAWALAVLAFLSALVGAALVAPAVLYRRAAQPPPPSTSLVGAAGIALGPLTPRGIVRVGTETWTAESLSGALAAGAPVHVAKVEGLRLLVWSEAGTVASAEDLDLSYQPKEEA